MAELDIARGLARQVMTTSPGRPEMEGWLWDRTQRLVCNVKHICRLPEPAKAAPQIDFFCLLSAAYFSEAALINHPDRADAASKISFLKPGGDGMLDSCRKIVKEKLGSVADPERVRRINRIISESWSNRPQITEAMILSDARNLEDMGLIGVFNEFRRHISNGKNISMALQKWQNKIDYQYWQARLKEGFQFEEVRRLAEQRLSTAKRFMEQLRIENQAEDMKELLVAKAYLVKREA